MCTIDRTCDICAFWSAAQWELFVKKRSYIDRMKPSCPSGYVPPAPLASPHAETPSGVSQLGLLPLLFPTLQVVRGRGGGLGMLLVLCPGGLPPLPLDLGPARGVGVLLDYSLLRALASLAPSGAGEGGVARSQRSFFVPAMLLGCLSPFLAARSTTWGIVGDFGGSLPRCFLSWFPIFGLVHGWIRELVHGFR